MQWKRTALLALCVTGLLGQEAKRPHLDEITVDVNREAPLHRQTCKHSSFGYLHFGTRTDLTPSEVGEAILADLADGNVLTVYPQSKSGILVYAGCPLTADRESPH